MNRVDRRPLLIFGPTGTGKSALALTAARQDNGIIINADSMQVYRDLTVLTARPSALDEEQAPHRLYGHIDGAIAYSTGQWLRDVAQELDQARRMDLRPIIVGGTGLYFKALTEGLAEVPAIDPAVRAFWRERAAHVSAQDLWRTLEQRDPDMANRLMPTDVQRITRALEVHDSTGTSLRTWHKVQSPPLLPADRCDCWRVDRDDTTLRDRLWQRLELIFAPESLAEVAQLLARNLSHALPLMRAVALNEARAAIDGTLSWEAARQAAMSTTWHYVRRQRTWARKQINSWHIKIL